MNQSVEERVRIYLRIKGRVQGVGFRAHVEYGARQIGGLTGWVRNVGYDTVEAIAEGDRAKVEADLAGIAGEITRYRDVSTLFGESASRAVVSVTPGRVDELLALAASAGVPAATIGIVGGDRIRVSVDGRRVLDEPRAAAEEIWSTAIEDYFERRRAIA